MSLPLSPDSPEEIYQRLLEASQTLQVRDERHDKRLAYAKIAVFLAIVIVALLAVDSPITRYLLLVPVALFVVLLVIHEKVLSHLKRQRRITRFYQCGLERIQNRWSGTGESGDQFLEQEHPYARDLDLFGKGSLFELLCTARTRAGEQTLASWLLHPAPPAEIANRQAAVLEMKGQVSFREELFVAGDNVRVSVHPEALASWAAAEPEPWPRWLPWLLGLLVVTWLAAAGWGAISGAWTWFSIASFLNLNVSYWLYSRCETAAHAAETAAADLGALSEVLFLIEQSSFNSPHLKVLRESLNAGDATPSAVVKKIRITVDWLQSRRNILVRALNAFLFCVPFLTLAAENWRRQFGPLIKGWLATAGEWEALAALAGYAFEHPADTFPEFTGGVGYLEAEGLVHPLLPATQAVANDLKLGAATQFVIVSGPNMAGKSTFLRGIGLNVVLAQCGAPVRATKLRLSPLMVGASICVLDSLAGGISRFYAEIQRLKLLADIAGKEIPLLFLLDELLSGTNSQDRYDGTRFMVRALVEKGAIGLVTTHDLALTRIPETMNGAGINCHFEDSMEGDRLVFDYLLKPGIVQTSNALKLMKAVGLEVGD